MVRTLPFRGKGTGSIPVRVRNVAQPGSASALGAEGRVFESRRSERVYVNGKRFGFQPEDEGSIPPPVRNVAQLVSTGLQSRVPRVRILPFLTFVAQLDRASDYGSEGYRFESFQT